MSRASAPDAPRSAAGMRVTEASLDAWLSAVKACPYATYFHTPYWYDIMAPGQNHTAINVQFDDGASALIPIAKIRRMGGLLTDHFSSPSCNYGGWISASMLTQEHVDRLAVVLVSKKNLTFRVNPFDPSSSYISKAKFANNPLIGKSEISFTDDFTHTLDLTKGEHSIMQGLSGGHRRGIKNALREGVSVKAAQSRDEWDRYYGLYQKSLERWRAGGPELKTKTVYPRSLFGRIYENRTGNETLWLAVKDGRPVSGALFFYWNRHAVYWHGASDARYFNLRPNNLLFWEAIADAARRGYKVLDFNPSGGYSGVELFKERFGAERVYAPILSTKTPLRSIIARLRGRAPWPSGRIGARLRGSGCSF
ncbi:MAG: GNAT family N-acetyltransferase [Chitinispirillales bacterium]|jgi:hypothetical protein|nr:GNAT family N-acetyltransferase [Chitinispirillales bacterium]